MIAGWSPFRAARAAITWGRTPSWGSMRLGSGCRADGDLVLAPDAREDTVAKRRLGHRSDDRRLGLRIGAVVLGQAQHQRHGALGDGDGRRPVDRGRSP